MKTSAVILAAGLGTRMRSQIPKVLHPLLGRPLVSYALQAAREATGTNSVMVVGHGAEAVRQTVGDAARFVVQEPQLGTGHAVQQAEALLGGQADQILVTSADMPLLTPQTLQNLIRNQIDHRGPFTMLTITPPEARGFGRVIRDDDENVIAIVEEAQALPEQLAIKELNAGVYCFDANWLWESLPRIPLSPKGEYYLTDLVEIASRDGLPVQAIHAQDDSEAIGVNTRLHLADAEALMRQRVNRQLMLDGVSIVDPATAYIEPGVVIGQDTTIWPNTFLQGNTVIGENCTIGPNTLMRDTRLGSNCQVIASVLEESVVEDDVDIGPYSHLRRGAHLAQGVHMGNFGEVKDSYLGPGTKMGHFSYVGNTTTGPDVNIGAGTITCNYDGKSKHPTEVGANVFIGSDTMLVAPVKLDDGSRTGAGSVVTKDVPANTLAVGAPARAIRKLKKGD
jgi:bifunctional UDP-N-acetylglucosamine pyrophosphorylase/glucosamine-1-phosphate N-acetyltransferase